jgi:hypothetical protein
MVEYFFFVHPLSFLPHKCTYKIGQLTFGYRHCAFCILFVSRLASGGENLLVTVKSMDPQQIRLSALGRDVQVGNLYNYYTDSIFRSKFTFFLSI